MENTMESVESKNLLNGKMSPKKITSLQTCDQLNLTCVNCKACNPQHVCVDFRTFICQECSDIHREYGHKIASIHHSEWTIDEYEDIQRGGNKRATAEYLAFWNPDDFPRPDKSEPIRMRDFIRKAYVIKCWRKQPDLRSVRKASKENERQAAAGAAAGIGQPAQPAAALSGAASEAPAPMDWGAGPAPAAGAGPEACEVCEEVPAPTSAEQLQAEVERLRAQNAALLAAAAAPSPGEQPPPAAATAAAAGGSLAGSTAAVAAAAAAVPPAAENVPGAASQTAASYVLLQKDSACFCPAHDSSEKRQKGELCLRPCGVCMVPMQTNYSTFAYCPACSSVRGLCMICGAPAAPGAGGEQHQCTSGGSSDGTDTPATSLGNTEAQWEADFSSDADSADASTAAIAVATAPAAAVAQAGFAPVAAAAPGSAAPAGPVRIAATGSAVGGGVAEGLMDLEVAGCSAPQAGSVAGTAGGGIAQGLMDLDVAACGAPQGLMDLESPGFGFGMGAAPSGEALVQGAGSGAAAEPAPTSCDPAEGLIDLDSLGVCFGTAAVPCNEAPTQGTTLVAAAEPAPLRDPAEGLIDLDASDLCFGAGAAPTGEAPTQGAINAAAEPAPSLREPAQGLIDLDSSGLGFGIGGAAEVEPAPPARNTAEGLFDLHASAFGFDSTAVSALCGKATAGGASSVAAAEPAPASKLPVKGLLDLDCAAFGLGAGATPCAGSPPRGAGSAIARETAHHSREPAEEPAPAPASVGAEAEAATLGDKLRDAVLSGGAVDLKHLYSQGPEPPRKQTAPHLAAYAAFDELANSTSQGLQQPMGMCPPAGPSQPPAVHRALQATDPFLGMGAQPPQADAQRPLGGQQPTLPPLGSPALQQAGPKLLSLQQLEQLSPQELVHMQMMISGAIQGRAQPTPAPRPDAAARAAAPQQARLPSASATAAVLPPPEPERPQSPPKQFGDLIAAFQERNLIPSSA